MIRAFKWLGFVISLPITQSNICTAQTEQQEQHAWNWEALVVRDTLIPRPWQLGDVASLGPGAPLGDSNRDAYGDYFVSGANLPDIGSGRDLRTLWTFSRAPQRHESTRFDLPGFSPISWQSTNDMQTLALVKPPSGNTRLIARYSCPGFSSCLGAFDLESGKLLFSIAAPPPDAQGNQLIVFDAAVPAGDVDIDGCDDVFFEGRTLGGTQYGVGILSGVDGSLIWQRFFPDRSFVLPRTVNWTGANRDLNGDQVPDCIGSYVDTSLVSHYLALSGSDGSVLWDLQDPYALATFTRPGVLSPDLSGDGISDFVLSSNASSLSGSSLGAIVAVSGATGQVLWAQSRDAMTHKAERVWGRGVTIAFESPVWTAPYGQGDKGPLVFAAVQIHGSQFGFRGRYRVAICLDAVDGSFEGFAEYPETIDPWASEDFQHLDAPIWAESLQLLGDIDGDGWTEIGAQVLIDSQSPDYETYYAIVGNRSWHVPNVARPDSEVQCGLFIPSSPGLPFSILASTAFDAKAGRVFAGWRTDLAHSATLQSSLSRPIRGKLDVQGRADLRLSVPPSQSLVGQVLYTQALVVDPSKPHRIKTMSSLGVTEIQ